MESSSKANANGVKGKTLVILLDESTVKALRLINEVEKETHASGALAGNIITITIDLDGNIVAPKAEAKDRMVSRKSSRITHAADRKRPAEGALLEDLVITVVDVTEKDLHNKHHITCICDHTFPGLHAIKRSITIDDKGNACTDGTSKT